MHFYKLLSLSSILATGVLFVSTNAASADKGSYENVNTLSSKVSLTAGINKRFYGNLKRRSVNGRVSLHTSGKPIFPTGADGKPLLPQDSDGYPLLPVDHDGNPLYPVEPDGKFIFPTGPNGKDSLTTGGGHRNPLYPIDPNGIPINPIGPDGQMIIPIDAIDKSQSTTGSNRIFIPKRPDGKSMIPIGPDGKPAIPGAADIGVPRKPKLSRRSSFDFEAGRKKPTDLNFEGEYPEKPGCGGNDPNDRVYRDKSGENDSTRNSDNRVSRDEVE